MYSNTYLMATKSNRSNSYGHVWMKLLCRMNCPRMDGMKPDLVSHRPWRAELLNAATRESLTKSMTHHAVHQLRSNKLQQERYLTVHRDQGCNSCFSKPGNQQCTMLNMKWHALTVMGCGCLA